MVVLIYKSAEKGGNIVKKRRISKIIPCHTYNIVLYLNR